MSPVFSPVGDPFAELILKDIVGKRPPIKVDTTKVLIGFIIGKVSLVSTHVNGIIGDMDIWSIRTNNPQEIEKDTESRINYVYSFVCDVGFETIADTIEELLEKKPEEISEEKRNSSSC